MPPALGAVIAANPLSTFGSSGRRSGSIMAGLLLAVVLRVGGGEGGVKKPVSVAERPSLRGNQSKRLARNTSLHTGSTTRNS